MTGWVLATETVRPAPVSRTPTRVCRETLYTLIALSGKYGKGNFAKVSLEDYRHLNQFIWHMNNNGYAINHRRIGERRRAPLMHREIMVRMGLAEDFFARFLSDHRNRDRRDNRRSNLRLTTRQQNSFNLTKRPLDKAFLGVAKDRRDGFFICYLSAGTDEKRISMRGFKTAEEAARVRDALARHYHGEFAVTNFEGTEAYDIATAQRNKREKSGQKSVYLGVTPSPKGNKISPWLARFVDSNHVRHYLGIFPTEEAAARAVDEARVVAGLERVNFP